jgi:hypothetical protein
MPIEGNTDWTAVKMPDVERRPYLVLIRSGDQDLFTKWPDDLNGADRNWDLMLSHWGAGEVPAEHADFAVRQGGFKYLSVARLWKDIPWLSSYKAVWLCDDDVMTSWADVQRLFETVGRYDLDIAQPALSEGSEGSHRITFYHKGNLLRFVDFVEAMIPLFSQKALSVCLPSFEECIYPHGLDYVWPQMLGRPTNKMAVIDAVQVLHARKVGQSASYQEMKQQKFSPEEQLDRLMAKYGLTALNQLEFGAILDRPRQARQGNIQFVEQQDLQLEGRLLPLIDAFAAAPMPAAWQGRDPVWQLAEPWLGGATQAHKIPHLATSDWCLSLFFSLAVMAKPNSQRSLVLGLGTQSDLRILLTCKDQSDSEYQLSVEAMGLRKGSVLLGIPSLPIGQDVRFGFQFFPAAGWLRMWINGNALPDVWYEPLTWREADTLYLGNPALDGGIGKLWFSPTAVQERAT